MVESCKFKDTVNLIKVGLRESRYKFIFSVIPMDNYPILLRIDFMDNVKILMISFANMMSFMSGIKDANVCVNQVIIVCIKARLNPQGK